MEIPKIGWFDFGKFSSSLESLKESIWFMINQAQIDGNMPLLLLEKESCEALSNCQHPISLMLLIYKLVAKILVNCIQLYLTSSSIWILPKWKINDNIDNAYVDIEYPKYTHKDVLILEVDIAKAFGFVRWKFIAMTMAELGDLALASQCCFLVLCRQPSFASFWEKDYHIIGPWEG